MANRRSFFSSPGESAIGEATADEHFPPLPAVPSSPLLSNLDLRWNPLMLKLRMQARIRRYQLKDKTVMREERKAMKKKMGQRAKRSMVWQHFTYVQGATSAKCPYCHLVLQCHSTRDGTSNLKSHLEHYCQKSPVLIRKKGDKRQSTIGFKPIGKGEGSSLTTHSFNQEKCKRALSRMCIKDNRPFSIVDDEGFREYTWQLNPMFTIPSRWTVARDCLRIYKEEAVVLKKLLKNQTVSLTTDTWSSVQNINYMCLTVHWVDDDWVLMKRILNFCPIANHRGETIRKLVYACLQKWGIYQVFTVTVDNASSNDRAIRYLKTRLRGPNAILDCKYMHLRCCAHIINLVVRDGLEEQNVSISRLRNAVRYVRSSTARGARFRECVDKAKVDCKKKPCLDVETRWNSTYLMLETAVRYNKAFDRMKLVDDNFLGYFDVDDEEEKSGTRKRKRKEKVWGAPNQEDWNNANHFIEYLSVFYNVTNLISGSKFVTSNLFFGELVTMHATISQMCLDRDEAKKKMALSMKEKYDKYWENMDNMNFLLHVAVVLDPRNKMCYLGWCLGQIYGVNSPRTKEMCDKVIRTLNDLFDHYKRRDEDLKGGNKEASSSLPNSLGGSTFVGIDARANLESSFLKYLEEQGGMTYKSEVEIYLSDGMEKRDDKFDILNWWKINSTKFPILSQVARHVLGMPISTVASESAFSTGGRVIDPFRSSLTPQTAEALICTQDWIRSTPADLELPDVYAKAIEELQEKLEKLETDDFGGGPKLFEPSVVED